MRLLDLFCGAGGAAVGYHRAGFDEIIGVDIEPQPNYPFEFVQDDALAYLWLVIDDGGRGFDAIHASPPCQAYSVLRRANPDAEYPNLIAPTRALLEQTGLPYIIENVPGAPLRQPLELCGSMFGLGAISGNGDKIERRFRQLRRHRLFETSFPVMQSACHHQGEALGVYGGGPTGRYTFENGARKDRYGRRGGYQGTVAEKREAMGIDWMNAGEINQAIPPAYTEHIGRYLTAAIERKDEPVPSEMPYKRNGCDLCGRVAPLSRIELAAGNREKLARVAYVCDNHQEARRPVPPVSAPLSPQAESLF